MQQLVLTENPPQSSIQPNEALASKLFQMAWKASHYEVPRPLKVFIGRFNQENRGVCFCAPYTTLRAIEFYNMRIELLASVPYEAIIGNVPKALDSLRELYGRPLNYPTNLCRPA